MTLEELNVFVTTQANVGMEAYYWWCTALMVLIHVGFLMYEVGATRMQNAVSSGVKNLLAFAFMIPTFWLFGWWIYLAFPGGFVPIDLEGYGAPGTGIIAGGPMRALFESLGVKDIVAKSTGSSNPHNMIKATLDAFKRSESPKQIASKRSKKINEIIKSREDN